MTRLALCGLGQIGAFHLPSLLSLRGVELVGVFDARLEHAREVAAPFGVRVFGSLEELLRESGAQAVVLATPSEAHRAGVEAALAAGLDVFVEKPLAGTLEDARAIVAAAAASPAKLVQVGFCERFNPAFIEAHRAVASGTIGAVRAVYSSRVAPYSLGNPAWELGVLDTATHNFDLILWLKQALPEWVEAHGATIYPGDSRPNTVATTLSWSDGSLAVDVVTWLRDEGHPLGQCARPRFSIYGETGAVEVDLSERPTSVLSGGQFVTPDTILLGAPEYSSALKLQFEAFLLSIEDRTPRGCSVAEAFAAEQIALAAQQSLVTGEKVRL